MRLSLLVVLVVTSWLSQTDDVILERGRQHSEHFIKNELDAIWKNFSSQMKAAFGQPEKLAEFRRLVRHQLGEEDKIIAERAGQVGERRIYRRISRFEKVASPILTHWAFDAEGAVIEFVIRPFPRATPSKFLDYRTKSDLRLPFDGEWWVFWGGRTIDENYHAATVDQRFAYDLVIRREGSTHRGDGARNEDYYCFGKRIKAPASGRVATVVDGIEDNLPGEMNPWQPAGNHVVIDHGNGEFSFFAHLQKGTVAVSVGQEIQQGTLLGLCGNSGNSSEPHLHYHLQSTPRILDGEGLPAQFQDYEANGQAVPRGEPKRGQTIKSKQRVP